LFIEFIEKTTGVREPGCRVVGRKELYIKFNLEERSELSSRRKSGDSSSPILVQRLIVLCRFGPRHAQLHADAILVGGSVSQVNNAPHRV
jgi:hypothetical protein